jgi:hypothetical protein
MRHRWNVKQTGDRCIITRGDNAVRQEAPRSRLMQQMAPHGVVDDIYEDLCLQLDANGKATVLAVQMGKFFQLG